MSRPTHTNEIFRYLTGVAADRSESGRLPSLSVISKELHISVARLREQLEVARALGFVEARPRTGMRRLPYSFLPAVRQSLSYAVRLDPAHYSSFSDLYNHLEEAYWDEAVRLLNPNDLAELQSLTERAWAKLRGQDVQIPHEEHRQLHLGIYSRLNNTFVLGLLEAYWEVYETIGQGRYADYDYLEQEWKYHQKMVDSICNGEYEAGYRALVEHKRLVYYRPKAPSLDEGERATE